MSGPTADEIIGDLVSRIETRNGQLSRQVAEMFARLNTQLSQALLELEAARSHGSALLRDVEHAEAQRDTALRELGEAREQVDRLLKGEPGYLRAAIERLQSDRDAALRSTAELRGALEAFKDCADTFDESTPDSFPLFSFNEDNEMEELEIELGDLRKARTALASSSTKET